MLTTSPSLVFRRCTNVLEDQTIVEGAVQWGNNDGLDVESGSNLTFSGGWIQTGDHCIAFRSGNCNTLRTPWQRMPSGDIQPLHSVTVQDMWLSSTSAAIKIEALFQEDHGNVSNVTVHNVTIRESNRGIGIWQRVGSGILSDIYFHDADEVHDTSTVLGLC